MKKVISVLMLLAFTLYAGEDNLAANRDVGSCARAVIKKWQEFNQTKSILRQPKGRILEIRNKLESLRKQMPEVEKQIFQALQDSKVAEVREANQKADALRQEISNLSYEAGLLIENAGQEDKEILKLQNEFERVSNNYRDCKERHKAATFLPETKEVMDRVEKIFKGGNDETATKNDAVKTSQEENRIVPIFIVRLKDGKTHRASKVQDLGDTVSIKTEDGKFLSFPKVEIAEIVEPEKK